MTPAEVTWMMAGPVGVALAIFLIFWRPWQKDLPGLAPWALPVAVVISYPLGHVTISSFPGFPPVTADEWLVYAAIVTGGWAVIEARYLPRPTVVRRIVRLALLGLLFWLAASSHLPPLNLGFLLVAVYSAMAWLDRSTRTNQAPVTLWILTTGAAASAPIFLMGASFKLAFLSATLAGITGAAALVSTIFAPGRRLVLSPFILPFTAILAGLFISGTLFALVPFFAAPAIAIACLVPLALSRFHVIVRLSLAVVLAAGSVGYTYYETQSDQPTSETDMEEWESQDPYSW